jgi:lactaldehyde reductase
MPDKEAAMAAADASEALMKKVGHPTKLRDVGVPEDNLPICAFHAIADTAVLFNGRPVNDPNDIIKLYQEAY